MLLVVLAAVRAAERRAVPSENDRAFRAWLQTVVWRLAVTHAERVAYEAPRPRSILDPLDDVPSPEDRYLARETLRIAATAPTRDDWRTLRAHANGVHVDDIAKREGIAVPSVYGRIRRARAGIRAAFGRLR